MKHKEINIGDVYDVRVKVIKKTTSDITGQVEIATYTVNRDTNSPMKYEMSWFLAEESPAFSPINSEIAPKYDPCRLFRNGDKVTPRLVNGRNFNSLAEEYIGKILTVTRDEEKFETVYVEHGGDEFTIDPAYLELVSPVEELEPYEVSESTDYFAVAHRLTGYEPATFWKEYHPDPAAAAEAECARLNAEYRKEQE